MEASKTVVCYVRNRRFETSPSRKQGTFATVSQTPVVAAAPVEEAVARHWPRRHPARHKTVTWRVAFAAFQAGRPIRRNPRYRPALKLQIQSRPFPFWSPTGLSNCGHFLCGLNCDGDDVEGAKSARKITVRECATVHVGAEL